MRTSLRDPNSTATVHARLLHEPSARRTAELTGAKEAAQLGALLAPPRSPLSPKERAARMKANKALEALYAPKVVRAPYINGN